MNNNFDVGFRVREIRQQHALSQEQLALRAGITPAYLGMVERGDKNPTVVTIEKLCDALELSLGEFFAPHKVSATNPDEICQQIVHQLDGKSKEEKQAILQLIKQVLRFQSLGGKNTR